MANTKSRQELKSLFVASAIPTEEDFQGLIDAQLNREDDGIFRNSGGPLSIKVADNEIDALRFYDPTSQSADWLIRLSDDQGRRGFAIVDAKGSQGTRETRLFIDAATGTLEVKGDVSCGRLRWGNSKLQEDQGGSIELGLYNYDALPDNQDPYRKPYIDFHRGGYQHDDKDFNVRIINDGDRKMTICAHPPASVKLDVNGSILCTDLQIVRPAQDNSLGTLTVGTKTGVGYLTVNGNASFSIPAGCGNSYCEIQIGNWVLRADNNSFYLIYLQTIQANQVERHIAVFSENHAQDRMRIYADTSESNYFFVNISNRYGHMGVGGPTDTFHT